VQKGKKMADKFELENEISMYPGRWYWMEQPETETMRGRCFSVYEPDI